MTTLQQRIQALQQADMSDEVFLSIWPSLRQEWLQLYPQTELILTAVERATQGYPQNRITYLTTVLDELSSRKDAVNAMRSEAKELSQSVESIQSMFSTLADVLTNSPSGGN